MNKLEQAIYLDVWRIIKPLRGKMIISKHEKHAKIEELVKYFEENVRK